MAGAAQNALAASFCQSAHATDVSRALGHADGSARIQQIEAMTCLDAMIIGRQRQIGGKQSPALCLGIVEMAQQL